MPVPPGRRLQLAPCGSAHIDVDSLRQKRPIADVVRRYGVDLRRSGSSFTGRCPFHLDGGRPNFVVFPYVIWNQTWGREQ